MSFKRNPFIILPIVFSTIFALMLFPNIVDIHGYAKSLGFTLLGMGIIWFMYFMIGLLINHIIEETAKRREADDNQDFV